MTTFTFAALGFDRDPDQVEVLAQAASRAATAIGVASQRLAPARAVPDDAVAGTDTRRPGAPSAAGDRATVMDQHGLPRREIEELARHGPPGSGRVP